MVRKLFRFLNRETANLHSAAYLLGLFALFSQFLAFLRDRLLAHIFGASTSLDIYYAAFRIPDFIFVAAASMVSLSVLVPFIIERASDEARVREFLDNIFTFFALVVCSASAVAFFLIPFLAQILFKGFSPEAIETLTLASRIMLVSPIMLGFSNLLGSVTQAYNRFTIYAVAPLLYNAGIIAGIILLAPTYGPVGVAIGVALGAIVHAMIQAPFVMRLNLFPKLLPRLDLSSIRRVIVLSLPRTLSLSTNYIAILFLISFASLMAEGSISILSLAINLQSVPLSIVGVSYSLAAFPTLSRHFNDKNLDGFKEQMASTVRHIIFWSLPLTALFIVLRAQVVRTLLGTGQFSWTDTRLTAAALALFVMSAVFQCLLVLFMRGFYSAGRTKEPFLINIAATGVLMALAYGFVKFFYLSEPARYVVGYLLRVGDLPDTAVLMLPLAFTLGTALNAVLHWIFFERHFRGFSSEVYASGAKSALGSLAMGATAYVCLIAFAPVFDTETLAGIFLQGLFAGLIGIAMGIVVLRAVNSHELEEVWQALQKKFWRSRVIAEDPEIV